MSIQERVKATEVIAIKPSPPVVVDSDKRTRDVIAILREASSGCALVTTGGRLSGIFTERDLINKVLGNEKLLDASVAEVMTPDPETVGERASIGEAILKMRNGGFRNIPVVDDDGKVIGCVRHKEIIAYLVEKFADRALNLPPDPDQIAKTPDGA